MWGGGLDILLTFADLLHVDCVTMWANMCQVVSRY